MEDRGCTAYLYKIHTGLITEKYVGMCLQAIITQKYVAMYIQVTNVLTEISKVTATVILAVAGEDVKKVVDLVLIEHCHLSGALCALDRMVDLSTHHHS